ncbi:MAG: class I SAM-dependent methyltransferase [Rhizobiaceae bacterium]|nr:class I SAM-dependent methyltransferase [Rhizobiaceae bacterium]
MPISIDLVELAEIPLHPYMQKVMDSGVRKHFKSYDAQRVSYAFSKAQVGETFLEVGPGRCDLTIMVARSGLYSKMVVIDIEDRSAKMPEGVDFRMMNVGKLEFEDNSFDSVYCMEVLEHLDDPTFESGLAELRRVCRGQLLITVPFMEPMPSKFHLQKFTEKRVREQFPNGKISLLVKEPVTRVPWLMVEEQLSD